MRISGTLELAVLCLLSVSVSAKLTWGTTEFLFTFGDSYTTDGFNISAGVDSPVPGSVSFNFNLLGLGVAIEGIPSQTSSNGQNWVEFLSGTYNVTDTKVFNLASGGATIDASLVTPFEPTVLSIVDQVTQFNEFLAPKPVGAQWSSNNSLFAIWIGINDVGNSFDFTNVTQVGFHKVLMARLFGQVEDLYEKGARSFLFLTVPPTNRAPLLLVQGPAVTAQIKSALADYNEQLVENVKAFQANHTDLDQVTVFDTQPIFNTLLDNAQTFGFVNSTGFCDAYQNGTPEITTQIAPCAPVSSYFWLNTLHPLFTVHNILAHALSTVLSA